MTTSGSVDTSQSGTYTVTYNCTDLSNNTTTRTATVHVIADTEPPMITLYGETETTLYIGQTYSHANDYSYYCNDNKDGYCYSNVTFSGDVDTSQS